MGSPLYSLSFGYHLMRVGNVFGSKATGFPVRMMCSRSRNWFFQNRISSRLGI